MRFRGSTSRCIVDRWNRERRKLHVGDFVHINYRLKKTDGTDWDISEPGRAIIVGSDVQLSACSSGKPIRSPRP